MTANTGQLSLYVAKVVLPVLPLAHLHLVLQDAGGKVSHEVSFKYIYLLAGDSLIIFPMPSQSNKFQQAPYHY